jgi:archaellum biogenesis ATPase FlaH
MTTTQIKKAGDLPNRAATTQNNYTTLPINNCNPKPCPVVELQLPTYAKSVDAQNENANTFDFAKFAINGRLIEMKAKLLDDVFVLGEIAILGQITVLYAKPNTGKTLLTLRLLIDSVKAARVKGGDVFYINADDTYAGMLCKAELCEEQGIHAIAPSENNFNTKEFLKYLNLMIEQGAAHGKVIVLDTLKKFTDLMDKKIGSEFMRRARLFVQNGGTLILLAHTNKRRDADGKVIAGGTSDVIDDADCAYTLDEIETGSGSDTKTVLFENIKARGNVSRQSAYRYSTYSNHDYRAIFDSVQQLDPKVTAEAARDRDKTEQRQVDEPAIAAITKAIKSGNAKRTELLKQAAAQSGISKQKISKVLDKYTGKSGIYIWNMHRGEKNTHTYYIND